MADKPFPWRTKLRPLFPSVLGMLLAVAYGLLAHFAFRNLWPADVAGILTVGFLFLVPMGLGGLTVYMAPGTERPSAAYAIFAPWLSCLLFMGVLVLFQLEFMICVVLAMPVFLFVSTLGGWVTYVSSTKWQNTMLLILLAAPYAITPLELQFGTRPLFTTTATQIHIQASPAQVWQQIQSVPTITEAEHHWNFLHAIGLPRPVSAELSYEGVGGQRDARFEDGLTFAETITTWQPNERISFTIEASSQTLLPAPLNMIGSEQFDVHQGTYVIEPLADGSVILHLSSEHVLQTRFNRYGTIWTDFIMSDLQNYILGIIKTRAEQNTAVPAP